MGFHDDYGSKPRAGVAVRVAIVATVVLIASNLFLVGILGHRGVADVITWLMEWMVLYFAARSAAQQQHEAQVEMIEPLQNVQGAGVGSALITAVLFGLFLLARDLLQGERSALLLHLGRIVVDSLIALGLGARGAHSVIKRNRTQDSGFYNF